jgi:hypothetical protein
VDAREQQRALTVPAIARVTSSRDFRTQLAECLPGSATAQTIIPTLPDDTMSYVWERLVEAGGSAVLALLDKGTLTLAVLSPASAARVALALEEDSDLSVSDDAPVDFFLYCLAQSRGSAVISRVAARLVPVDEVPTPSLG